MTRNKLTTTKSKLVEQYKKDVKNILEIVWKRSWKLIVNYLKDPINRKACKGSAICSDWTVQTGYSIDRFKFNGNRTEIQQTYTQIYVMYYITYFAANRAFTTDKIWTRYRGELAYDIR